MSAVEENLNRKYTSMLEERSKLLSEIKAKERLLNDGPDMRKIAIEDQERARNLKPSGSLLNL